MFGGFSPEALKDRILDSDCQTVITADEGVRGALMWWRWRGHGWVAHARSTLRVLRREQRP